MFWENNEIEAFFLGAVGLERATVRPTLVQLALDGSWDRADARVFTYGGVVGLQSNWMALGQQWAEVLLPHGIKSFHMVEAMNFRGQFARLAEQWGKDRIQKRQELLETLVSVVEQTNFSAFGFSVDVRLLADQKKAWKKKEMFQAVVLDALKTLHEDYRLGILCDREQDAAALFLGWLENLMQRNPQHRERVWALCFVDDRYVPAAQVADMWTYLLRENTERQIFQPGEPEDPLFARLRGTTGKSAHLKSTRDVFLHWTGIDAQ